jgi:HlyD family secretion protein
MSAIDIPLETGWRSWPRRSTSHLRGWISESAATSAKWLTSLAADTAAQPAATAPVRVPVTTVPAGDIPAGDVPVDEIPAGPNQETPGAAAPKAKDSGETDLPKLLGEPATKLWLQRPALWLGAAALVLIAGGIWWWLAARAANAAPVYSTQAATRGDVTLTVSANGTIQPTRTISIGSELSGTVLKVNVDVNDHVKRGQVMVVLDTAKLRDQVLRSQASLATATANVALAAATTAEARANLNRLEEVSRLSNGRVPSRTQLDSGRATLARSIASGTSARAGVRDARAGLSTDQINLSKASITAPADGVVLTRTVDPGNAVAASLQAVTLFTIADDLSKLRLWVYVDEADVGAVKVDQDATFTVSAFPTRKFPARITRVGFGSTITDNVVTYLTYLDVDNSDLSLRPGMTATASITAVKRSDVLLVPNTALRFTPSNAGAEAPAQPNALSGLAPRVPSGARRKSAATGASTAGARQVWVLREGLPVATAVTPGVSDGRMTEITGGALQAGMLVITDQKSKKNGAPSP